jgi:hypothetical protein
MHLTNGGFCIERPFAGVEPEVQFGTARRGGRSQSKQFHTLINSRQGLALKQNQLSGADAPFTGKRQRERRKTPIEY